MKQIWLLFILSIIFGLFLFSCSVSDSEITAYPVQCDGILKDNNCSHMLIPLNKTTFKVSEQRQEIIYWTPGIMDEPRRLINCIVRDKENWIGEYQDSSGKISMINGKLTESPSYPGSFHVSKWRWWYINLVGKDMPQYLKLLFD